MFRKYNPYIILNENLRHLVKKNSAMAVSLVFFFFTCYVLLTEQQSTLRD